MNKVPKAPKVHTSLPSKTWAVPLYDTEYGTRTTDPKVYTSLPSKTWAVPLYDTKYGTRTRVPKAYTKRNVENLRLLTCVHMSHGDVCDAILNLRLASPTSPLSKVPSHYCYHWCVIDAAPARSCSRHFHNMKSDMLQYLIYYYDQQDNTHAQILVRCNSISSTTNFIIFQSWCLQTLYSIIETSGHRHWGKPFFCGSRQPAGPFWGGQK